MKRKHLLLLGVLLVAVCAAVIVAAGSVYTLRIHLYSHMDPLPADVGDIGVALEGDAARLEEFHTENDDLVIRLRAVKKGKTRVRVQFYGEQEVEVSVYTHLMNVLTCDEFFGDSTGDAVIPVAVIVFLAACVWYYVRKYRADVRQSLYRYRNVMDIGIIVYLCFMVLFFITRSFNFRGLLHMADSFLGGMSQFSMVVLPFATVLFIFVTLSSVRLMRREGRTWRNMLGVILGVALFLFTLAPLALDTYLQWSPNAPVDVHNEGGVWLYIEITVMSLSSAFAVYLECILLGTVVSGVKAARHVPPYDRDYMLILGCQIGADGSLPPLLRSRADRALAFAAAQKEHGGKELVFVPSGGQGADEIMPEGEAIKNYLISVGIPEARILPETRSADTFENIRNSMELIRAHAGGESPKTAFSTTNYHVFRAGLIAESQGERLEGVGSPTKRYFWINAFIREFIATLVAERKKHVLVFCTVAGLILISVLIKYVSAVI